MSEIYYFGCWGRAGHFLFDPSKQEPRGQNYYLLPRAEDIDASPMFLPHPERKGAGALTYLPAIDLTILAWWGNPWDNRGKVNSAVLLRGRHDVDLVWSEFQMAFLSLAAQLTKPAVAQDAGGKVLVPREPTPKMVVAGWQCAGSVSKALDCYRAMLAAAGAKNYE